MIKKTKADTQAELAGVLGVSRQSLINWRKIPGAPESLDEQEWRDFMNQQGLIGRTGASRDIGTLKVLIAEQELEKKQRENQVARQEVVPIEEVTASASRATAIWQTSLKAKLETEAPTRLVGKDIAELRAEIRMISDELCAEVAKLFDIEP